MRTDLPAGLGARSAGQDLPGVDVIGVLRPRPCLTVGAGAARAALDPRQPSRPTEAGQIPDVGRATVLSLGANLTAPTAREACRRLHGAHHLGRGELAEAVRELLEGW